ncbi:hypothetical protein HD554DRAFT_2319721 [Boletus coccyginus]|nr:hypothetical protein HD554DRAFT_2319721 [Boletus coccyginus]
MVALMRPSIIVAFRPPLLPWQWGMHGHIIIFPQEPERVVDLLPPPIMDIITPICVIFVGSSPPSKQWLHEHACPLIIRKEKVYAVLMWLWVHNPFYKDIQINRCALQLLEDEDVLPVHVEVVPMSNSRDSLTAWNYEADTRELAEEITPEEGAGVSINVFKTVVVANVDLNVPSHVLHATAAMEHIVPHGASPVRDINNLAFFPLIYPTLFPYGLGAPKDFN